MEVLYEKQTILNSDTNSIKKEQLQVLISEILGLGINEFYLISNGRRLAHKSIVCGRVYIALKTPGGKGGFGSMLRAIGAQIEKTTNREACRDLSGRRLRDINEEQRLKKWVAEQADREKEAKERKKKKLEKLLEQPKHTFVDKEYDKERSSLPEKVEDAVLQGLEASCSTKRKSEDTKSKVIKKKRKLWMDSELDEDISSSESENGDQDPQESTNNFDSQKSCSSESENGDQDPQESTNTFDSQKSLIKGPETDCNKIKDSIIQTDDEISNRGELPEASK